MTVSINRAKLEESLGCYSPIAYQQIIFALEMAVHMITSK